MKHTIIECDLCNGRIYRNGWFFCEDGAVKLRTKVLSPFVDEYMPSCVKYKQCKRRTLYICPKCVDKIKKICKGGKGDAQDT